jgi:membrane-bound metal-dependent hydrolase YbcI (DUF457 family)
MPFTPYHFGPSGFIGLVFKKWIDIPVFLLANVAVDLEPGIVLLFDLNYPEHGFCHTFLFGTAVGLIWGTLAYPARSIFGRLMRLIALPYQTNLSKMLLSAVLGVWLHILLDSLCWSNIQPFWPFHANPLLNLMTVKTVYMLCTMSFVPALFMYIFIVHFRFRKTKNRESVRQAT